MVRWNAHLHSTHPPFRDQERKKKTERKQEKGKKTKESRMEFNYKAVLQMIAPQHEWSVEDPIHPEDLNLELSNSGTFKTQKAIHCFCFSTKRVNTCSTKHHQGTPFFLS